MARIPHGITAIIVRLRRPGMVARRSARRAAGEAASRASRQRLLWPIAVGVALLLGLAGGGVRGQDERVAVRLDGRALFRVGPTATADAATRAGHIERRLDILLQNPGAPAPARVEPTGSAGGERVVTVAGVPVVTVTEEDARDNLTTTDALATQWAGVIDAALQRAAGQRQSAWGRFVAEVRAAVETAFSRLLESAITIIPRALAAVLVLVLFWLLASAVRWLLRALFRRVISDLTIENLLKQLAYYAVWALGLLVAVDALGFDPQAVATGLGLTGLAIGFALRDILSNFVSGLLLLATRPFAIGDQIVVGETEGSVERIALRATQVRTYDGRAVLVPNAEILTSRITNNTASPIRRGGVELPLGYDSDLPRALAAICAATQGAPGVLAEPPASVRVRELGPDDIIVEARFWTDSRRADFVATASVVRRGIVEALKAAGVGLPEPDVRLLVPGEPTGWRAILGEAGSGAGTEHARRLNEAPPVD